MRLFIISVFTILLMVSQGQAQEENVAAATSSLQSVLSNLKESVDKLSLDNNQLTLRDNALKQQVLQLQMQLGGLQAQGDALTAQANKLKEENSSRAERISDLETENHDWEQRNQKSEGAIKSIQESLNEKYQDDQKLLLKLRDMQNILPLSVQSPEDQAQIHRQKEKLQLMKMIYDSQQRQDVLHQSLLELQKNAPFIPAASALERQQFLKEQIKDLEAQIASYSSEKTSVEGMDNRWDGSQLQQLEDELKSLERNYSQLKNLMEQMTKKAKSIQVTVGQRVESDKLQGSIEDLKHQSVGLRADLDDLRSQMVDLDKRKSHLEEIIQHTPSM